MKFLIFNYSNAWVTEPLYLHTIFNGLPKSLCSSSIYNNNKSLYDNFDTIKPDIVITKYNFISEELLSYIKDATNIKILINIDGLDDKLDNFMNQFSNIYSNFLLFGRQRYDHKNYIQLLPSADIFIKSKPPSYKINKLIFIDNIDQKTDYKGTYHYTSTNKDMLDKVDFILPIIDLGQIYSNYDEIILKDSSYIGTQLMFNAIYSETKVKLDFKDKKDLDKIDDIFKGQKLLSAVKNKHMCFHRAKSLSNVLSLNEVSNEISKVFNI
jgi:hypothetical protein